MSLFGPSKDEVWRQLDDGLHVNLIEGGFWKGSRVEARHLNWTIYLDTHTVSSGKSSTTYTRMRAPFVDKDQFYFKIYRNGVFSGMGKALGMQDIEVGYPEFDEQFIIQGSDEDKVVKLFSNPRIRLLLERQPKISLEIKKSEGWFGPSFKEDEGQLYFLVAGVIKDLEVLKDLFELFSEVLEELALIGSVGTDAPEVRLY